MKKVFLFGIDGAPPDLVFGSWKEHLPNISKLMERGCYARLQSTIPPTTIVAWNSMISGKDTSEIGVFSYTYRDEEGNTRLVNSYHIQCDLMWDIIGKHNKKSIALYVPLSYPVKPIKGIMVSDFLTPSVDDKCAYPLAIKEKIQRLGNPDIFFDVVAGLAGHKSLDIKTLIERTYLMTDMQVALLHDILQEKDWSFCMAVMIGTDRLQHMIWRHVDETHRRFIPNSPHKDDLLKYYIYLDAKLGETLKLLDEDTTIIVASDHGMVKQEGKINLNNWLIKKGYLVLKSSVDKTKKQRFDRSFIDMEKTMAYGGGAYNARVYVNKKKAGLEYKKIREKIAEELKNIPDDKGNPLNTKVYRKEEVYKHPHLTECPDLTIYFDDLRWASNPDLGYDGLYSWETALGADSAGHAREGIFIIAGPEIAQKGYIGSQEIAQVAPTILSALSIPIPHDIEVKRIEVFS